MSDDERDEPAGDIGEYKNELLDDIDNEGPTSDLEDEDGLDEIDVDVGEEAHYDTVIEVLITDPERWMTIPYLTKFERAKVLSERSTQVQTNRETLLISRGIYTRDQVRDMTPEQVANDELVYACSPMFVRRVIREGIQKIVEIIPVNYLLIHGAA